LTGVNPLPQSVSRANLNCLFSALKSFPTTLQSLSKDSRLLSGLSVAHLVCFWTAASCPQCQGRLGSSVQIANGAALSVAALISLAPFPTLTLAPSTISVKITNDAALSRRF
jgi:hypothetical protein